MKYSLLLFLPLYRTHLLNYTLLLQLFALHYLVLSHSQITPWTSNGILR